jgi:3-oxoacyl-[acyl-carrier protein] reductase
MEMGLKGKVAVVAAASKGLGRACAFGLAREGAAVALCARDGEALAETAEAIRRETGAPVLAVPTDLANRAQTEAFVAAAAREFGRIDILVSNTGGPRPGTFMELDDAAWEAAFATLVMPAVRLTRLCVPAMQKAGGGKVIYITSVSTKEPIPNLILSNSLRMAVAGMAKTLAAELAPAGIRVACVLPGRIETDRVRYLDRVTAEQQGVSSEHVKAGHTARIPLGRYGDPAEFADAVVFLASDRASYLTGVSLQVDGGAIRAVY